MVGVGGENRLTIEAGLEAVAVVTKTDARECLEREQQTDAEVVLAGAMIAQSEAQCRSHAREISIQAVTLLLHCPVAGLELVDHSEAPLLVQPIVHTAIEKVISPAPILVEYVFEKRVVRVTLLQLVRRPIAEVAVPQCEAPVVVGQEGDRVINLVQPMVKDANLSWGSERPVVAYKTLRFGECDCFPLLSW